MTLNEERMYDTDYKNFIPVYRDLHGDVAFSEEEALKTYTDESKVVTKYTYDYGSGIWYESEEQARNKAKSDLKVTKSLYYYIDGKYYNLFDEKDIAIILNNMDDGFYGIWKKDLLGNTTNLNNDISGDVQTFNNQLKEELQLMFEDPRYLQTVTSIDNDFKLTVTPKAGYRMTVQDSSNSRDYFNLQPYTFNLDSNKNGDELKKVNNSKELKKWFIEKK